MLPSPPPSSNLPAELSEKIRPDERVILISGSNKKINQIFSYIRWALLFLMAASFFVIANLSAATFLQVMARPQIIAILILYIAAQPVINTFNNSSIFVLTNKQLFFACKFLPQLRHWVRAVRLDANTEVKKLPGACLAVTVPSILGTVHLKFGPIENRDEMVTAIKEIVENAPKLIR